MVNTDIGMHGVTILSKCLPRPEKNLCQSAKVRSLKHTMQNQWM